MKTLDRVFLEEFCFALTSFLKRKCKRKRVWLQPDLVKNSVLLFKIYAGNEEEGGRWGEKPHLYFFISVSFFSLPSLRQKNGSILISLAVFSGKNIAALPQLGLSRSPGCDTKPAADLCVVLARTRQCWCQG